MSDIVKSNVCSVMPFNEMKEAAEMMAKSGLFPQWNSTEKMMSLMLLCRAEGCDPISAVNRYDNIQGRVSKKPQAMLDDFIAAGGKVQWTTSTNNEACATFTTPDGLKHVESFTMEDARRAGLANKDVWKKYPKAMLRARCISAAMRAVFPGATNLMYTPEETEDIEPQAEPKRVPVPAQSHEQPIFKDTLPNETQQVEVQEPVDAEIVEDDAPSLDDLPQEQLIGFLRSIGWLGKEGTVGDLTSTQRNDIMARFESFKEKVEAYNE